MIRGGGCDDNMSDMSWCVVVLSAAVVSSDATPAERPGCSHHDSIHEWLREHLLQRAHSPRGAWLSAIKIGRCSEAVEMGN